MIKFHEIEHLLIRGKRIDAFFKLTRKLFSFLFYCNGKKKLVKILVVSRKSHYHIKTFLRVSKRFERLKRVYSSRREVDLHYRITYLRNFEKKIRETFKPKRNCSSTVSVANALQKEQKTYPSV